HPDPGCGAQVPRGPGAGPVAGHRGDGPASRRRGVTTAPDPADAVDTVVGFARTLRAAGVDATAGRVHALIDALAVLDPTDRGQLYWAGRASLCASHDDVERYDRAFDAYFGGEAPHERLRAIAPPRT